MRHTQTVGKGFLKGWQGILIVLGVLLYIYVLNVILMYFTTLGLNFLIGSILFWVFGVGLAVYLFYRFSLLFEYDLGDAKLVVSRIYIKNPRVMLEILTREMTFVGTPEEAAKRYPQASVQRALTRRSPDPVTALVYMRGKSPRTLLIEPNAEMRAALMELTKK